MKKVLYLDHAASAPVSHEVVDVVTNVLTKYYANPSSIHCLGKDAKSIIDKSRNYISNYLHCNDDEIIFTSGACEANSLALSGWCSANKGYIITSQCEHKSILNFAKSYKQVEFVDVLSDGRIDLNHLRQLCCDCPKPFLVSLQAANSEIGTIQDLRSISQIVHNCGGKFHTDATQLFAFDVIDVKKYGIDMFSMSGQKIGAPKGIGFLYVNKNVDINPIIFGSQMESRRGGTENIAYIAALAKAISLLFFNVDNLRCKQNYFIDKLYKTFTDIRINGSHKYRLPNNISVSFPYIDAEALVLLLSDSGICVSSGSACNSKSIDISPTLQAIGVPIKYIHGTIRITISQDIDVTDIDYVVSKIKENVQLMTL